MNPVKTDDLGHTDSLTLARAAARRLLERKAGAVAMYRVSDVTTVTDYYVNATGRSSTQVGALADDVAEALALRGRDALRMEGRAGGAWVLVDYGDVIVNVFDPPSRELYPLDRLFPAECAVDISDLVKEVDETFDINRKG